ncbi:MAG: neutral/alkaline non-lysosomal ceramidase N-terminal domain-containing protein [Verrucomicrobia bacterium]|nr:neutral/alkaline non-lysosomal ceramidase N-terminal domain-containing protein [Verrucomicrobiota bacterium]
MNLRLFSAACVTIAVLLSSPPVFRASAEGLRAGTAKIDITPDKPVTLAGYASRTNLSRGVHDPLSARATAFEQDGQRMVLLSLDLLGFYNGTAEPLREAILSACRLQPSDLFLSAIHTHSAPTPSLDLQRGHSNNVEYTRSLQGKLVEVTRQALERMAPMQVGVGSGSSPVGANRREVVRDNSGNTRIVLGRNPSLAIDREVQVLKLTRSGSDELAGVLFAYATHSTSLGPRNYLISGDVHGLAAQFLEKHLGPGVVAPPFAGASGNIDPWYRVLPEFNTTNGWIPEPVLLGTLLGEEVAHVLKGMRKPATSGAIKTAIKTVALPGKPRGEAPAGATAPATPLVVTVGCVGDTAFVGLGGEIFTEIGLAIKAASPFPHTFILTHCNGAAGYLPIRSAYPEGGYEVQSSSFAPGADEQVIEEVKRMLAELRKAHN